MSERPTAIEYGLVVAIIAVFLAAAMAFVGEAVTPPPSERTAVRASKAVVPCPRNAALEAFND